jgi:multidrug efflux pump subunit AcrB
MHGQVASNNSDAAPGQHSDTVDPAVTITVSKRKGTNSIEIADKFLAKADSLKGTFIPDNVRVTMTRNYGETASQKSNNVLRHVS